MCRENELMDEIQDYSDKIDSNKNIMCAMKKKVIYFLNALVYLHLSTAFQCDPCYDSDYETDRNESVLHDQKLKELNPDFITRERSMSLVQAYLDSINPILEPTTDHWLAISQVSFLYDDYFLTNETRAEWLPFIRIISEDSNRGYFVVPASQLMNDSIAPVLCYVDSLDCDHYQLRNIVESTSHYLVSSTRLGQIPMSEWTLEDRKEALRLVEINMNWKQTD